MISLRECKEDLLNWKSSLAGRKHIDRSETDNILTFLTAPGRGGKEDILFLVGNAGSGKSVVMHDVLVRLEDDNQYKVVALKADMLKFNEGYESISNQILCALGKYAEAYKTVFLVDQIDALSQCLSSNRQPLNIIDGIIEGASKIDGVKVIVSCRPYDLNYDPILRKYRTAKSIYLQNLDYDQIKRVLECFDREVPSKDSKLAAFLRLPLHLDLFLSYGKDDCEVVSLQSLFDNLWSLKITSQHTFYKDHYNTVQLCVDLLAESMYNGCRLVVDRKTIDLLYKDEIAYLLSEGVLVESSDKENVMFLHQSLFDYAYARLQYERGKNIISVLKDEHQGLFVRNRIKQMLAYIREADVLKYIDELNNILVLDNNETIRFHIKMLLLSTIGSFENVLPIERDFVEEYILTSKVYRDIFIEGAQSEQWFKAITGNSIIKAKVAQKDSEFVELIFTLCRCNIYQYPSLVTNYLTKIIDVNDIEWNRKLFAIVEGCRNDVCLTEGNALYLAAAGDRSELIGGFYLREYIKVDPEFVKNELYISVIQNLKVEIEKYKAKSNERWYSIKYIDNGTWSIIEDLWDNVPEVAFDLSVNIVNSIDMMSQIGKTPDRFNLSSAYLSYSYRNSYSNHDEIVDKIINYLVEDKEGNRIKDFFTKYKNTQNGITFYVLLYALNSNVERYKEECIDILCDRTALEGHGSSISYLIEEMLKRIWPLLCIEEKRRVINILLAVAPKTEEIELQESVTGRSSYKGHRRFSYLSMIPDLSEINEEAFKEYEDLKSEYNTHSHTEPYRTHVMSGWAAMNPSEVESMDDDTLIEKYIEYDNDRINFDRKPTMTGNCRQLEKNASQNPARTLALAKKLLVTDKVNILYPVYAISGLLKSDIKKDDIVPLVESVISKLGADLELIDKEVLMHILRLTDDLCKAGCMSEPIIDFLCNVVKSYPDYDDDNYEDTKDIYNTGINRIRGCAAFYLLMCYRFESFGDKIFEALETCVDASLPTKGAIVFQQAYLNNLDKDRNLKLYLNLLKGYESPLLCIPLTNAHPLLYFINTDFERLTKDFFPKALLNTKSHEVFVVLLWIAWVRQLEGAENLLFKLMDESDVAKAKMINYFDKDNVQDYSDYIYPIVLRYADSNNKEVGNQYDFFSIDAQKFDSLRYKCYMDRYTKSESFKYAAHGFMDAMKKKVGEEPISVLRWICRYINTERDSETQFFFYSDALSILTTAYNAIGEYSNRSEELDVAMDTFDSMLKDSKVRMSLRGFLNALDN